VDGAASFQQVSHRCVSVGVGGVHGSRRRVAVTLCNHPQCDSVHGPSTSPSRPGFGLQSSSLGARSHRIRSSDGEVSRGWSAIPENRPKRVAVTTLRTSGLVAEIRKQDPRECSQRRSPTRDPTTVLSMRVTWERSSTTNGLNPARTASQQRSADASVANTNRPRRETHSVSELDSISFADEIRKAGRSSSWGLGFGWAR
jgi:hypothetical protein